MGEALRELKSYSARARPAAEVGLASAHLSIFRTRLHPNPPLAKQRANVKERTGEDRRKSLSWMFCVQNTTRPSLARNSIFRALPETVRVFLISLSVPFLEQPPPQPEFSHPGVRGHGRSHSPWQPRGRLGGKLGACLDNLTNHSVRR